MRFLDRHVADQNQYLEVQYRDGRRDHQRGPRALFFDPCVHQLMRAVDAYKLAANEATPLLDSPLASLLQPELSPPSLLFANLLNSILPTLSL